MKCTVGQLNCRSETFGFAFGYMISVMISHIYGFKLIEYSEGSLFWALNSNLISPCALIFWMLFTPNPLKWQPHFQKSDWFCISATIIILPTLVYYSLQYLIYEIYFRHTELTIEWVNSGRRLFGFNIKKIRVVEN
ncbi:hypothetical protein HZS_5221 [Henneguya salminicola]|nr:hypothetical protein HZS_5221 [Henneguya salminicola]